MHICSLVLSLRGPWSSGSNEHSSCLVLASKYHCPLKGSLDKWLFLRLMQKVQDELRMSCARGRGGTRITMDRDVSKRHRSQLGGLTLAKSRIVENQNT